MDKPIELCVEEFKQQLVMVVNQSGLPPFVLEPILKETLVSVQNSKMQRYQQLKKQYESALAEESEEKDGLQ